MIRLITLNDEANAALKLLAARAGVSEWKMIERLILGAMDAEIQAAVVRVISGGETKRRRKVK